MRRRYTEAPTSARTGGVALSSPTAARAWLRLPITVIAGTRDRLFPIGFMRQLTLDRLDLELVEIDAGHLIALSRPQELVVAIAVAPSAAG